MLPAETLGNGNYEWRPELGGWRDKTTNVVWGYSVLDTINAGVNYSFATSNISNYPQYLFSRAQSLLDEAASWELAASMQTDPLVKQRYLDLASSKRADSASTTLAATDAKQYTNWRSPTLAEFRAAWNKGLFTRGSGAFNLDMTPFNGYQSGYGGSTWTSNPPSPNKKLATVFSITSGQSYSIVVSSQVGCIAVRTAQ